MKNGGRNGYNAVVMVLTDRSGGGGGGKNNSNNNDDDDEKNDSDSDVNKRKNALLSYETFTHPYIN